MIKMQFPFYPNRFDIFQIQISNIYFLKLAFLDYLYDPFILRLYLSRSIRNVDFLFKFTSCQISTFTRCKIDLVFRYPLFKSDVPWLILTKVRFCLESTKAVFRNIADSSSSSDIRHLSCPFRIPDPGFRYYTFKVGIGGQHYTASNPSGLLFRNRPPFLHCYLIMLSKLLLESLMYIKLRENVLDVNLFFVLLKPTFKIYSCLYIRVIILQYNMKNSKVDILWCLRSFIVLYAKW